MICKYAMKITNKVDISVFQQIEKIISPERRELRSYLKRRFLLLK